MKRRALSLALALIMCLGLLPAAVFAEEGDETPNTSVTTPVETPEPEPESEPEPKLEPPSSSDFKIENGVLTQYVGRGGDVTIPNGVTSIGTRAFYRCSSLTSVTIPSSVTSIGLNAFEVCSGLTSVTISNGVKSIGRSAFYYCTSLTSVTIPSSVTSIENSAFSRCNSLTSVTILEGVADIGDFVFDGCSNLTSVTIPSSVTSIGGQTFKDCTKLEEIDFGGTLAQWNALGYRGLTKAIVYCSDGNSYPDFKIENGVLTKYTGNSINVTIPSSVTSIGDKAFRDCTNLVSVTIPSSVTAIGYRAFDRCLKLKSVTIASSVTAIGYRAFDRCLKLKSVTIASSVTTIGDRAFEECENLTSVEIPNSVTAIGDSVFDGCSNLTSVTIPSSVTSIGVKAFRRCKRLTSVEIPNSVTTIGDSTFENCENLTSVKIPNSVTSIGRAAFSHCYKLTSVDIPNSVTSMGISVFAHCENLTRVEIPNSMTSIGRATFSHCYKLTSVDIPNSVTSIVDQAFNNCYNLTDINFSGTKAQWAKVTIDKLANDWLRSATVHCSDGDASGSDASGSDAAGSNTGTKPTTLGCVEFSSSVLDFGTVYTGSAPAAKTVTVKNVGDSAVSIYVTGFKDDAFMYVGGNFDLNGKSGSSLEYTLQPGESASITIQPHSMNYAGNYDTYIGAYVISDKKYVRIAEFQVKYSTKSGSLDISPVSLSFDTLKEGYAQPAAKTVTAKNTSDGTITLSQPTASASNFELSTLSKTTLAPDASATFTVRPKAGLKAGTYGETIIIKSTDGKISLALSVSVTVEKGDPAPVQTIPATGTAYASTQSVLVDGKKVEFQMYALKNEQGYDTNYIKLPGPGPDPQRHQGPVPGGLERTDHHHHQDGLYAQRF